VRQSAIRTALVIGNPSTAGFVDAFPFVAGQPAQQPPDLSGAQDEAEATAAMLGSMGYQVEPAIGVGQSASEILTRLYQRPWRIVHISAHGAFDLRHVDGRSRSGVLLSDGLLITAAEIAAMEIVPELVFLNCCHLGQVDTGKGGNKLAASIARELIEIGVRCVVVAGWAVNDESAQIFGQSFYKHLLLHRLSFGDAVFKARKEVFDENPQDITWGAFQAYGEPGWLAEPRAEGARAPADAEPYASPDELLDDLAGIRAELSRRKDLRTEKTPQARVDEIETLLKNRCRAGWLQLPQLQSALGTTWLELSEFERARKAFLAAVQAVDRIGLVPIRDIEQLANVEARLGERCAEAEMATGGGRPGAAEDLIDTALKRLAGLDALLQDQMASDGEAQLATGSAPHNERSALRGSAWKRKASLRARRVLSGKLDEKEKSEAIAQMNQYLKNSVEAYRSAEGSPGGRSFKVYNALNRLALDALTPWKPPEERETAIELAQQCRRTAAQDFAAEPEYWNAVNQAEARLVERLLDRSLGLDGQAGRAVFDELVGDYTDALSNVTVRPSELDSTVVQMELLSRFYDALAVERPDDDALPRTAGQLLALAAQLMPNRPARTDRPKRARAAVAPGGADIPVAAASASPPAAAPAPGRRLTAKSHTPRKPPG
jgi:hypothetical protein